MTTTAPAVPSHLAIRPKDADGRPVPWYANVTADGVDYGAVAPGRITDAMTGTLCWTCGRPLPRTRGAVFGFILTMPGTLNRLTTEPPSHVACAEYAVRACPHFHRAGPMAVWHSAFANVFPQGEGGMVVHVGQPAAVTWWVDGRPATRDEATEGIRKGLEVLEGLLPQDADTTATRAHLADARTALDAWLPAATHRRPFTYYR